MNGLVCIRIAGEHSFYVTKPQYFNCNIELVCTSSNSNFNLTMFQPLLSLFVEVLCLDLDVVYST